jgi:hypothetical protein
MQLPNKRVSVSHGGTVSPGLIQEEGNIAEVTAAISFLEDVVAGARIWLECGGCSVVRLKLQPNLWNKHRW